MLFVVMALRAVIELVVWLLLGCWILRALAGKSAGNNVVLGLFDLLLCPPRRLMARLWPKGSGWADLGLLLGLLLIWLLLGLSKRALMA